MVQVFFLGFIGCVQSPTDNTFFAKKTETSFVVVLVYVDDILIASNDPTAVDALQSLFRSEFKIKYLGPARFFLGLERIQVYWDANRAIFIWIRLCILLKI